MITCLVQRRLFFSLDRDRAKEVEKKQNLLKVNHMLELDVWLFGLQPIGWLPFRWLAWLAYRVNTCRTII